MWRISCKTSVIVVNNMNLTLTVHLTISQLLTYLLCSVRLVVCITAIMDVGISRYTVHVLQSLHHFLLQPTFTRLWSFQGMGFKLEIV